MKIKKIMKWQTLKHENYNVNLGVICHLIELV